MATALTARLQIAVIASFAFHRLEAYEKLVEGAINAAAATLQYPPVSHHHLLRYTSDIQEAGMTSENALILLYSQNQL